jgi:hypothetical protein
MGVWVLAIVPLYPTNYTIEVWTSLFVLKILLWELCAAILLGLLIARLAKNDPDRPWQGSTASDTDLIRRSA